MLWDYVYEFFVAYIFGGYYKNTAYYAFIGQNGQGGDWYNSVSPTITIFNTPLSLGNYLSLIATIISMVAIVLICCALIKKIYNMCAHIIG